MGMQTFQNGSSMFEDRVNTHGRDVPSLLPAVAHIRWKGRSHTVSSVPREFLADRCTAPWGRELDDSPGLRTEKTILLQPPLSQESRYMVNTSPAKDACDGESTERK